MDALNANTEYFMNQSATPVKNDASEAYDMLHKIAPSKFTDRNEFLKRYGVDAEFSRESLQRLIGRYNYSSATNTGVKATRSKEAIQLTAEQGQAYKAVEDAFRRASRANMAGTVDIEAMKTLSPYSFAEKPIGEHKEIAQRLQTAVGTIKEERLNAVVNAFAPEHNAKMQRLEEIIDGKQYQDDQPRNLAKKGDRAPGVVFAHNLKTVDAIKTSLEKKGMRVGVIRGDMSGKDKERVKVGFNPPNPSERKYDVIVLSDAGATGLNLQNAKYLVNFDLPQTAWVKKQREGRIDRHGQVHAEIDYHDLVTDTPHEKAKWERVQRKARLGDIFQAHATGIDDTGLSAYVSAVRQERLNNGNERSVA
jgi:superfamily II DNA or RNA helicase